jgi:hypothetical protein
MADDVDVANDRIEQLTQAALTMIDTRVPDNDTGECIWCNEPVNDKRRWCCAECRDQYQQKYGGR